MRVGDLQDCELEVVRVVRALTTQQLPKLAIPAMTVSVNAHHRLQIPPSPVALPM